MSTPVHQSSLEARQIRILLVDHSTAVRPGLRTLLDLLDGVVVIGEAADGAEAGAPLTHLVQALRAPNDATTTAS